MKIARGLIAAVLLGSAAAAVPASAAELVMSGGKLAGATGVSVGGKSYDVSFMDGTCSSVFGGCTSSNFTFTTATTAYAAGQALLSQVFLNSKAGQFDSRPNLTVGCTSAIVCDVLIPYAAGRTTALVIDSANFSINALDTTFISTIGTSVSTTSRSALVYAKFVATPVVAAVPETATWAMMLAGFGMIGFAARRRKSVKTTVTFA